MTIDDLPTYCDGRIARYKIPRYVRVMDSFPMTVTGKIRQIELREEATRLLGRPTEV